MYRPLRSLQEGHWFKLICGASYQHLPAVRSLTLAYALAGADCIDVAADPAVVATVQAALRVVVSLAPEARSRGYEVEDRPWLMVSLNDGEDPHFRKAEFDSTTCPTDCARPCAPICPTQAIVFNRADGFSGVIDSGCYGCGRCLSICPVNQITARAYVSTPTAIAPLVLAGVDAVELHTQIGRLADFTRLWHAIEPFVPQLKLIAISCPDGEGLIDYLQALYQVISPLPCALIWQTDGRPMSGDIGMGATRAAIKLGQKVLAAGLPGYVQLAGGTNAHTVSRMKSAELIKSPMRSNYVAGVAYGSYARSLLSPVLEELESAATPSLASVSTGLPLSSSFSMSDVQPAQPLHLEAYPDLLWRAVALAQPLVSRLKREIRWQQTKPKHLVF